MSGPPTPCGSISRPRRRHAHRSPLPGPRLRSRRGRVENLVVGDPHGNGIGLLRNVTIAPHLSSFHLEPALRTMVATLPGLLGIGIDEATALELHGDVGQALGRGKVTIYAGGIGRPPVVLEEGARYDLIHRKAP
jgi:cyanophycinase